MTVAIYARVSTSDQSPEAQLQELREFAQRRKFRLFSEYVDQVTGLVERRPHHTEYNRLLADAHRRRFDCVLVWKFDRFARSLRSLIDALQTFDALGIHFISATQQIDTTTPMGRLFFNIVGSFAEFERELIGERTRAGLANARRKGHLPGIKRNLAVESQVRNLRVTGLGLREIARRVKRSPAGVKLILGRGSGPLPPAKVGQARG